MIGETIKDVELKECSTYEELLITMESGRKFKISSHEYCGDESYLELVELNSNEDK